MKKRNLFAFRGDDPKAWSETNALGPFTSEAKARKAIKEDLENSLDNCQMLSPGRDEDYAEPYHIMEVVKSFKPVVTASVSVSLGSPVEIKEHQEDLGDRKGWSLPPTYDPYA